MSALPSPPALDDLPEGRSDDGAERTPLNLQQMLQACRERIAPVCTEVPAPFPAFTLIFSVTDGQRRARVTHVRGDSFDDAWSEGARQVLKDAGARALASPWLRVDWVEGVSKLAWGQFEAHLKNVKRNYFRLGLALDAGFDRLLTEQELNANAMLYAGPQVASAQFNKNNFEIYLRTRFPHEPTADFDAAREVYLLATAGVFCQDDGVVHRLAGPGLDAGRRQMPALTARSTLALVAGGSGHLARQVQPSGQFVYGLFPCFDRRIPGYNTLRHASSLYAMLEAWELTRDAALMQAIERSLAFMCGQLIRERVLPDGTHAAFLVDVADEIKLGGCAVCLLALAKHAEATGSREWLALMERLAQGIGFMQDRASGRFVHVLHAHDLSVKQASRIVYYDGEAAFGLMRLYALTRDPRWLLMVEQAFEHFIASQHWQAHDHWLSYCVNELTRWRPREKYFRFGIQNVAGYLDFVLDRKTTFPTLLELMLAAHQMLERLQELPELRHLLDEVDLDKFHRALDFRAHYLLNGVFWPELAMYFRRPASVAGAFFIRHHSFRVRIDDVEHYLSGFVGYHRLLVAREAATHDDAVAGGQWSAEELAQATGGRWVVPPPPGWRASGVAPRLSAQRSHVLCVEDAARSGRGALVRSLQSALRPAAAILCSDAAPHLHRGTPLLQVDDVARAMLALGARARARYEGPVAGIVSAGEPSRLAALLAGALGMLGPVAQPEGNTRTPKGTAWSLCCMPRSAAAWVVDVGRSPPPALMRLLQPTVLVLPPAAAAPGESADEHARARGSLMRGLPPGVHLAVADPRDAAALHAAGHAGRVLTYGEHANAQVRLLGVHQGEVRLLVLDIPLQLHLKAAGLGVGIEVAAALAAVLALGLAPAEALRALGRSTQEDELGPFHRIPVGDGAFHLIDQSYDANPASMRAALALLGQAPCPPAQRVALLGDMQGSGHMGQAQHEALAEPLLQAQPDRVLLIGPLMHFLHLRIRGRVQSHWFADVAALSDALGDMLRPGDWVLAKASRPMRLGRLTRALKTLA
ncbi:glutamate ligase domain-containing protein [Xenophilus azovorans]|uniref:glutamate ligase domain-containing protein n=1 Tax=Xenophilus azovorans TaxID=151755 RepID=UPI001FE192F7|nr:Mur ligase [Xenophilus azovorans]